MLQKRVEFPKNYQRKFIKNNKLSSNLTWKALAQKLNLPYRTFVKTYRYEVCKIPYKVFQELCKLNSKNIREELKKYNASIKYQKTIIGRKVLGENRTKLRNIKIKYPKRSLNLDTSLITLNSYDKKKNLKFPKKLTPFLAEEIGIHLGDGFLSNKKNNFRLKGNKKDEKEYYDTYIKNLYKKLYNLDINLKEYETTYGFEIASQALWHFKTNILEIKSGRKDNISIPKIIKTKDIKILTSFIRGIFDTDGSVSFISAYGFKKYYPHIGITLKSKNLIDEIYEILVMLGFEPKKYKEGDYWKIHLRGYKRLERYSKLIGWNNPKHLNKVKQWKNTYPKLSSWWCSSRA